MIGIDKILEEWSFRCHDGIVDLNNPEKVTILNEILDENGIDIEEKLSSRSAKYIAQQNQPTSQAEPEVKPEEKPVNTTFTNSSEEFTQFILDKYAIKDQTISGLDTLYTAIQKSPNKDNLFKLIQSSGNRQLKAGKSSIQSIEGDLFNLIMSSIKIKNGEPSELWFAIMYNGKAKGGVAKGGDIESDVDVDGTGVSIKNYTSISNLDFGSLPAKELKQLKQIINLLVVLTGIEFTAGIGRDSLNNLLRTLKDPSFQEDVRGILKIGADTQIKALQNMYASIVKYVPNGDVKKLVDEFIDGEYGINKLISDKITKVQWWAIINKGILYLEPSDAIASRLRSEEGQLSPVFAQIKGNNLFVNGNRLLKDTKEEQ